MINTGKTTFILDAAIEGFVNILTTEQKADLFTCILAYANRHLEREPEEAITRILFDQIRTVMDSNNASYYRSCKLKSLSKREQTAKTNGDWEKANNLKMMQEYLKEHDPAKFLEKYPEEEY